MAASIPILTGPRELQRIFCVVGIGAGPVRGREDPEKGGCREGEGVGEGEGVALRWESLKRK